MIKLAFSLLWSIFSAVILIGLGMQLWLALLVGSLLGAYMFLGLRIVEYPFGRPK